MRRLAPAGPRSIVGIAMVLGLLLAIASWLRLDSTTRGTVWAEDGSVFLSERRESGPFRTILQPYAGYLHVVPRLLVDAASLVPLDHFAVAITALTCAAVGVVGALVFVCSGSVIADVRLRVALGAITALVPQAPVEVLGNTANLHYYLLWLSPWVLLAAPRSRWQGAGLALTAALIALTEIQSALFLPLLLVRFRDRKRWPVAIAFVLGVAAQVVVTAVSPRPTAWGSVRFADVVDGYVFSVVVAMWHPSADGPGAAFASHGWRLAVLELLPFVAVLVGLLVVVVLAPRRPGAGPADQRGGWLVAGVLTIGSVVPAVAGLTLNAGTYSAYSQKDPAQLADARPLRYGVVSAMFLLALFVALADQLLRSPLPWREPVSVVLTIGMLVICVAHFDSVATRRGAGPSWSRGVRIAEQACRAAPRPAEVDVPIAPQKQGWKVTVRCRDSIGQHASRLQGWKVTVPCRDSIGQHASRLQGDAGSWCVTHGAMGAEPPRRREP